MNTLELRNNLKQKLDTLSLHELEELWQFTEFLQYKNQNSFPEEGHLKEKKPATVIEKMGGDCQHFFEGQENLSDRDIRKQIIAEKIKMKYETKLS